MLPGKKYKPEDFLWIAWTRKWFIVLPTIVIGAATFAWSSQIPNLYRAQTTIVIVPQKVPTSYVEPTITTDVSERLQFMSQQILSRTRLEQMIQEFNLYPEERSRTIMEDVVERMRTRDVNVAIARPRTRRDDTSSFTVSFQSENPRTALAVTEKLASLFMQENVQDRALLADATTQFLETEVAEAHRKLVDHEKRLEAFRQKHAGRLPSQADSNLQLMQSTQARLLALAEEVSRDRDRLTALENALAATPAPAVEAVAPRRNAADTPITAAQQLEMERLNLKALLTRVKEGHPDVAASQRRIVELEALAATEREQQQQQESAPVVVAAARPSPTANTARLQLEANELRQRLASRKQEEAQLQRLMMSYSARIEAAPALESELTELMRDYTILQKSYGDLRVKSDESKLAGNLERQQIGEQFRVIDSARLPEKPFSPNRLRINLMGLAAGFGLGVAFVALLTYRDTTLKTDEDVMTSLALPVLAVIPVMVTADERRSLRRRRLLLAVAASAATVLVGAVAVAWRFNLLPSWIR